MNLAFIIFFNINLKRQDLNVYMYCFYILHKIKNYPFPILVSMRNKIITAFWFNS